MSHQITRYDEERLVEMYRKMKAIREFELRAEELANAGAFPGGPHLYIGQEAVAVGACQPLRDDDVIGSTHRGHGHMLAKGADIGEMMAELGGTVSGTNGGRGGTMHMVDFSLGIFGLNGILGASAPHVAGGVFAAGFEGDDRVGVSFFGDGAANEGIVYETMNLAAVWDLPVVFCCENNGYGVTLSAEEAIAGDQIADRAASMGIPSATVDGQDVLAVYEAARDAVERARDGGGPQFLECETYRYREHSFNTERALGDRTYRDEAEIERWKERDPIDLFVAELDGSAVLPADRRAEIDAAIEAELDAAIELMREGEHPPADHALEDMYASQDYPNFPAPTYR